MGRQVTGRAEAAWRGARAAGRPHAGEDMEMVW